MTDAVLPRDVDLVHGVFAGIPHPRDVILKLPKERREALRIFLDKESVPSLRDPLRRAGIPDQDARQAAGGRFPHHDPVGVVGGREQEEIRAGVPRP